ncbi:outer membrane efflux protein [Polymorphobacter multimanifer]|uniref:efflux transporter outer membrane subunit n=1 Tax=Polymorphobacter multimanifer TaxID=1070431 RepID=UPI0016699496|nr:efflux transporter outer membrane subunit [Polymorphobacter multimanifer]GGI90939.1 outer membrane efflux protein [Polymorphobacter multimanifer]
MKTRLLMAALPLSGCALGPDYAPAPLPPVEGGALLAGAEGAAVGGEAQVTGWRGYDGPRLGELVGRALAANTDLRAATARLRQVRAVLSETRSQRLPSTSITGSAVEARQAVPTPTGPVAFESEFYRLGLDASYEIDLYGRVTRSVQAARADFEAEEAARDTVRITVAAETARAYADACSAAAQLAVAERSLKLQADSFGIAEKRVAAGRDSPLDVARARAQLESTRATLPAFTAQRAAALNRLAVLTGRQPAQVDARVKACTAPPLLKTAIPVGDGAALLRRRPDVRQAERRLAAATARIGVAMADFFPQISLGGSVSGQGVTPGAALSNRGFAFSIGPAISWTFPNFAAARARTRQARAGSDEAVANFEGSMLAALEETETALANYAAGLATNEALRAARDESARAARIVRLRYGAGSEGFLAVLDAERTLATADAQLAANDADLTTRQIAVFKALGGGWEPVEG